MNMSNEKKNRKEKNTDKEKEKLNNDYIPVENDNIPLGTPLEEIKKSYPALYREIVGGTKKYNFSQGIVEEDTNDLYSEENDEDFSEDTDESTFLPGEDTQEIEQTENEEEGADTANNVEPKIREKDYLEGFDPKAVDFIRRCKSSKEALDIINYLERRHELDSNEAQKLRQQLETEGLTSFGIHKDDGYYFKIVQERKLQDKMHLHKKSISLKNTDNNGESQDYNDSEDMDNNNT